MHLLSEHYAPGLFDGLTAKVWSRSIDEVADPRNGGLPA